MGKLTCLLLISIFLKYDLSAQDITISTDSLQILLCKKWQADFAIIGGMKLGKMPGVSEMNFDFRKDRTFIMTGSDEQDKKKGTWTYMPSKKLVQLTIDGRTNFTVISLKEDQLVLRADIKDATPDDPLPIQLVFKLKPD